MNIEHYINLAEAAMIRQTDYTYLRYAFVIRERKLVCAPATGLTSTDVVILLITRHQLRHGLLSGEWTRLGDKVMKVMKELRL